MRDFLGRLTNISDYQINWKAFLEMEFSGFVLCMYLSIMISASLTHTWYGDNLQTTDSLKSADKFLSHHGCATGFISLFLKTHPNHSFSVARIG